jgi:heme oxygenase
MTITPFSSRLRAATWADHASAEQSTFLADLTKGRIPLAAHVALTAQHYLIYEVLEQAAAETASPFHSPALTRLPALRADLEHLAGEDWAQLLAPTTATEEYVARLREIAFTWPGGFVAHHYNRYLGDLSGGQYVARAIAKSYNLTLGEPGLLFYSFPLIEDLQAFKESYRSKLDAAPWDELEMERIIDEVKLAYRLNTDVLNDLGKVYVNPFPPEVVAQIMKHMNGDHAADSVLICRAFGGQPDATEAVMSGMDADAIEFDVTVDGGVVATRIPFSRRLTQRAEVRVEVTRLYHEARAELGLPPA